MICRLNPGGVVTYVNPAGEQVSGYSAGELVGRNRIIEWVLPARRDSNDDPVEMMGFGNDITCAHCSC
ncbi:MAG: PAS domain S-box protein [candidate division Zixibacteria bacterium]|nr:PAS domain S-box protein [candidate division Zixibacteria bacterium]